MILSSFLITKASRYGLIQWYLLYCKSFIVENMVNSFITAVDWLEICHLIHGVFATPTYKTVEEKDMMSSRWWLQGGNTKGGDLRSDQ